VIVRRTALIAMLVIAAAADAQPRATALAAVRIDENLGERVPTELWFSDAAGRRLQLGSLLDGERPTLLVLTYVRCRLLCSLVLHGTLDAVRAMPLALGRDYQLVIVSIDHKEEAASAAVRAAEIRARAGASQGLHYLVGAPRPIAALAASLGFRFAWDDRTEQFAHPAVIFVLGRDATITRYLHGVRFDPVELARSLRCADSPLQRSAAIGTAVMVCFRFDPAARAHRELIEAYLKIGAGVVMTILGSVVLVLFWWERRRRRS
jgi:protein SCO1/2